MDRPSTCLVLIAVTTGLVVTLAPRGADAADLNLKADNAPPIARQMTMTLDEFHSLLPDRLKPYAAFAPASASMTERNLGRQDGQLFIWGKWGRKGNYNTGPLDLEYRVATKGPHNNPAFCYAVTALSVVLPARDQPEGTLHWTVPARRIDIEIRGSVNAHQADPEYIRKYMAQLAKSAAEGNGTSVYLKPRHIPDLGFGLDRNDMFVALEPKADSNGSCEVNVHLADSRKALYVEVRVKCGYRAVSPKQTTTLAKNAAAIMARKVFGVDAEIEQGKDEKDTSGFTDAWITDRPGPTPEQDHRVDRILLGQPLRVACTYRLPRKPTDVEIVLYVIPGPDAVSVSRDRCQRVPEASIQISPLQSEAIRFTDIDVTHLADGKHEIIGAVSVRTMPDGQTAAYFTIPTGDIQRPFIIGPGTWEVEVLMRAYQSDPENEGRLRRVELSKLRTAITIADDPAFSAKILRPAEKRKSSEKSSEL